MRTIDFSPAVQRALAAGISDLRDGDESDIAAANEVQTQILTEHGQFLSQGRWYPVGAATEGYIVGPLDWNHVFIDGKGRWIDDNGCPIPHDTQVYFDALCEIPVCVTP